ncbi:helix-turn-helix domain-containing protein [Nonomuraea roseoviolacea]|uniref:TetR/AcrR family transcriptional regulator n=1 Tax=Nonomuraea roseoviolacea TaxID=103837 RepID=UPI0031E3A234
MKPTPERIVEAARDILVREGARAVTMRRVADTAGVTAMAVHKHCANRQALLDDVAERAFRRLGESRGRRAEGADGESRVFGLLEDFWTSPWAARISTRS